MSWLFSRALVAAFSEESSSDGELSAPSKSNPTPQAYLSPDRMTAFSRLSRFGMTFAPLTDDRGAELLTWFLGGFPAKTSALRERVTDSTDCAADCGEKWGESWAKYDHASSTWKTRQHSLLGGLDEFLETWPRWGLMRNGALFPLPVAEPSTCESESGFSLPTIGKNEFKGSSRKRYLGSPHFRGAKMSEGLRTCEADPIYLNPSFGELAMGWPIMWTALAPLAMDKFQLWLQQHGEFSQEV